MNKVFFFNKNEQLITINFIQNPVQLRTIETRSQEEKVI